MFGPFARTLTKQIIEPLAAGSLVLALLLLLSFSRRRGLGLRAHLVGGEFLRSYMRIGRFWLGTRRGRSLRLHFRLIRARCCLAALCKPRSEEHTSELQSHSFISY